jgi:H+-transporting ATPase
LKAECVSIKAIVGCALDLSPQLVERVHKLYEELGREDVRAVQEWEDGERETADVETKK